MDLIVFGPIQLMITLFLVLAHPVVALGLLLCLAVVMIAGATGILLRVDEVPAEVWEALPFVLYFLMLALFAALFIVSFINGDPWLTGH